MKVSVLSAYPFHMVHQARQLARLGALERLITAVPVRRTGLPRSHVRSRIAFSAFRHVARKVMPSADAGLSRMVVRDFDRWAQSQLGDATVLSSLSGFGTATLAAAAKRGVGVTCDRGSWHILEQKKVLDDEAAAIGCPPVPFDPFFIERELEEYGFADRIVVPSELARRSFLRRGLDPGRVAKVPYGVDAASFTPSSERRQSGAIVSVGTIGLQKGHRYLVEAFRSLRSHQASLTLVGPVEPGWDRRLRLSRGDVRVTGALARAGVIRELQRASMFVLASLQEGLALVVAEAMACGVPVVATETTGAGELIDQGVEGLIVPPRDARAIANALDALLADPDRTAEMGRAGRARVAAQGGWNRYGKDILSVLREIDEERQ